MKNYIITAIMLCSSLAFSQGNYDEPFNEYDSNYDHKVADIQVNCRRSSTFVRGLDTALERQNLKQLEPQILVAPDDILFPNEYIYVPTIQFMLDELKFRYLKTEDKTIKMVITYPASCIKDMKEKQDQLDNGNARVLFQLLIADKVKNSLEEEVKKEIKETSFDVHELLTKHLKQCFQDAEREEIKEVELTTLGTIHNNFPLLQMVEGLKVPTGPEFERSVKRLVGDRDRLIEQIIKKRENYHWMLSLGVFADDYYFFQKFRKPAPERTASLIQFCNSKDWTSLDGVEATWDAQQNKLDELGFYEVAMIKRSKGFNEQDIQKEKNKIGREQKIKEKIEAEIKKLNKNIADASAEIDALITKYQQAKYEFEKIKIENEINELSLKIEKYKRKLKKLQSN